MNANIRTIVAQCVDIHRAGHRYAMISVNKTGSWYVQPLGSDRPADHDQRMYAEIGVYVAPAALRSHVRVACHVIANWIA